LFVSIMNSVSFVEGGSFLPASSKLRSLRRRRENGGGPEGKGQFMKRRFLYEGRRRRRRRRRRNTCPAVIPRRTFREAVLVARAIVFGSLGIAGAFTFTALFRRKLAAGTFRVINRFALYQLFPRFVSLRTIRKVATERTVVSLFAF